MRIYLIRHGQTTLQKEHRYQGITDTALSEEGRRELRPAGFIPDLLVVTNLRRTKETADILFPGVEQCAISELAEMNFGSFEGRNYIEMEQDPEYRAWVDGMCLGQCPGGESKAEFSLRVTKAFEKLMRECLMKGMETLAVVSHGGTMMAILEAYALPKKYYFDWHYDSGKGCILEANGFPDEGVLRVAGSLDYTVKC